MITCNMNALVFDMKQILLCINKDYLWENQNKTKTKQTFVISFVSSTTERMQTSTWKFNHTNGVFILKSEEKVT